MADVERHEFAAPFFAGSEHLDDNRIGDELRRRPGGGGVERNGRRRYAVDHRAWRRDHFDGSERAMIFWQIVGHRRENRLVASTESRMVWQVDPLFCLWAAAGKVEQQAIAGFLERDIDFPGVARVDSARVAPLPVGDLADSLSQDRFGIMQHLL